MAGVEKKWDRLTNASGPSVREQHLERTVRRFGTLLCCGRATDDPDAYLPGENPARVLEWLTVVLPLKELARVRAIHRLLLPLIVDDATTSNAVTDFANDLVRHVVNRAPVPDLMEVQGRLTTVEQKLKAMGIGDEKLRDGRAQR